MTTDLAQQLRELGACDPACEGRCAICPDEVARRAADEIERLQRIIDSRPAINAGLPESYVQWSRSIYALDVIRAMEKAQ